MPDQIGFLYDDRGICIVAPDSTPRDPKVTFSLIANGDNAKWYPVTLPAKAIVTMSELRTFVNLLLFEVEAGVNELLREAEAAKTKE